MVSTSERTDVTTEDRVFIARDRIIVFDVFWDPTHWERLVPHVERVEMLENGATSQLFKMIIRSGGELHHTLSRRHATRPERIVYEQLQPPVLLRRHTGVWEFVSVDGGTEVQLRHAAEIALSACHEQWPDLAVNQIRNEIARLLSRNGRRTIEAIAEYLA